MPSSTVWRRPTNGLPDRGQSPVRPPDDCVERLSPGPNLDFPPPPPPYRARYDREQDIGGYPLRGLGLSDAGFFDSPTGSLQPDHLYYDQEGAAHVGARRPSAAAEQNEPYLSGAAPRDWSSKFTRYPHEARRSRGKGHTRSGSTIDDLASAAIATSPTFANGSPRTHLFNGSPIRYNTTRPSTSYTRQHYNYYEEVVQGPPAKRIKSERLPAAEWSPRAERPRTSNSQTTETIHEEALLLLSLKNEVNFKMKAQYSPPAPAYPSSPKIPAHAEPWGVADHSRYDGGQIHNIDQGTMGNWAPPTPQAGLLPPFTEGSDSKDPASTEGRPICTNGDQPEQGSSILMAADLIRLERRETLPETADSAQSTGVEPHPSDVQIEGSAAQPKRPRRVKPEVQAEVCASCQRLQRDSGDETGPMFWISCDACHRWFHSACAGFKSKAEARSVDKFLCQDCEPEHGKTTFVRKSSRPRTAIDYAGLNQGVVKSSAETSMHHYIQPIKDGKMTFLPDDFARIRPELLTAEFMESFDGMKRPFVVPACWNPRFGIRASATDLEDTQSDSELTYSKEVRFDSRGNTLGPDHEDIEGAQEEVIDCDQDLLDMIMPRNLTVRKVAELYGPDEPVPVIDVKSQETKGSFTLKQWADYYELTGEKPIRNVISLEVSESRLGRLIRRPKVVRDLDLEDQVWDAESRKATKKRPVQFYCLMSVTDSYTDFHIDFGGSAVYYHILKGRKTFFFIPPEDKYLKKYEDWCNSDTQNVTFLGDLCGGNCTRIDLQAGDTAFIPAGWIHAVWTPEDTLVIGGNFLTRLDYEMQIKVANIEKVTKVATKFRYPFFQKVMWYTLIKYLEDDPVPVEVLHDFHDDLDYTYLRANPVWHEIGDLENTAEPGEPTYNARYYPKSEINGLPALRDFLYRTARVHADLPVPDINKKGIDAVKASVPKGHGDPLKLAKEFAVWCAWKIGNVTAPEWIHSDGPFDLEKKEKIRKPEVFRLPGERSSTRKASQVRASTSDSGDSPPAKQALAGPELENDSGKKTKNGTKGTGLRVACDACRKRRIKCRHRADSPIPTLVPSENIRPKGASGSEHRHPLVSFRPPSGVDAPLSPEAILSVPVSDLAQAALATIESQSLDGISSQLSAVNYSSTVKKSRSKACEECRKSKRRCVHDEHGRIDPAKAAEPSKPRSSTSAKRPARLSDGDAHIKRAKTESETDRDGRTSTTQVADIDVMIDPALMNGDFALSETDMPGLANRPEITSEAAPSLNDPPTHENAIQHPVSPDAAVAPPENATHLASDLPAEAATNGVEVKPENVQSPLLGSPPEMSATAKVHTPPVRLGEPLSMKGLPNGDISKAEPPSSGSRQSPRQSKQVERFTPEDHRSPSKVPPKPVRSERRASSAASGQTMATSTKSRRSSSNTSGTIHQMAGIEARHDISREASARPVSRGSTVGGESDLDADARLARELQAAENGLRRRTSMRA